MADVVQVETGFPPWQPAPDAELVKEYQYYEIPLVGVIAQHGARYLFVCLAGADERYSSWAYVALSRDDEASLDSASPDDFSVSHRGGPLVLALAREGDGILSHTLVNHVVSAARWPVSPSGSAFLSRA